MIFKLMADSILDFVDHFLVGDKWTDKFMNGNVYLVMPYDKPRRGLYKTDHFYMHLNRSHLQRWRYRMQIARDGVGTEQIDFQAANLYREGEMVHTDAKFPGRKYAGKSEIVAWDLLND